MGYRFAFRFGSFALHKVLGLMIFILMIGIVSAAAPVALSDQGTGVKTKSTGILLASGSLKVDIYDAETGGNLIYSEIFPTGIVDGKWNLMLGANPSNPLYLDYGKKYFRDYSINGIDVDFMDYSGATVERQFFFSPLGTISAAGYFVGKTDVPSTGEFIFSGTSGYDAGNKLCSEKYAGSHVCSEFEIAGSIAAYNISSMTEWSGVGWVISGGAKFSPADTPANDCNGFTHGVPGTFLGTFWIFETPNGGKSALGHCGNNFALTCCR